MRRTVAVTAGSLLVLLAGCGSNSASTHQAGSSSTASPKAATSGKAAPVAKGLPTATGGFGDKPAITYPKGSAPKQLEQKVLDTGSGPVVKKGDLLVANYLGQVWNGKVFDNSYDRNAPAGFQIGAGKVIPGWDDTLVGKHVGSRVLLVIPSDKGYGAQGQPQAGIPGGATLTFVVDIVGTYGASAAADAHATVVPEPAHLPTVSGPLGAKATVTVAKGTPEPKTPKSVVLAKGSGAPLAKGTAVVQFAATYWNGQAAGSTWQQGVPAAVPVGSGTPFDSLVGTPVGSRVLLDLPASTDSSTGQKQPAVAVVVDIVAQPNEHTPSLS